MRRLIYFIFLAVILLSGCSFYRIDSQNTTLDFYPQKPSADQVLYQEKIDRAHEVIGIVTVTAERTCPLDEIVSKMKIEAAILGGDAITDIRSSAIAPDKGGKVKGLFRSATIRIQYLAKVVVFK